MNTTTRILLAVAIAASLGACAKKVKPVEPSNDSANIPSATDTSGANAGGRYTPADLDSDSCLRQRVVYFDLDQDTLRPEFQAIIACHGKYLTDRPEARVTLEGNADERGSREYNLGLGERRGNGVSAALQGAGGSASQSTVVSYGEERPTCTESSEACWSKNRRVEIVYTAK